MTAGTLVPIYDLNARRFAREYDFDANEALRFAELMEAKQDDPAVREHFKWTMRAAIIDMVLALLPDSRDHKRFFEPVMNRVSKRVRDRLVGVVPAPILAETFDPMIG